MRIGGIVRAVGESLRREIAVRLCIADDDDDLPRMVAPADVPAERRRVAVVEDEVVRLGEVGTAVRRETVDRGLDVGGDSGERLKNLVLGGIPESLNWTTANWASPTAARTWSTMPVASAFA